MADLDLDFLEDDESEAMAGDAADSAEAQPEAAPEPEPEAVEAAPVAEEPTETGDTDAGPPPAESEGAPRQQVPLEAVQSERGRRQDAEMRLAEMQKRMDLMQSQLMQQQRPEPPRPVAQPEPLPDPIEDPAGYSRAMSQRQDRQMLAMKLQMSRNMAEGRHGKEAVDKAAAYFDKMPELTLRFAQSADPFGEAVAMYERMSVADRVGTDVHAYEERIKREAIEQYLRSQNSAPAAAPPPSIAVAPSAAKLQDAKPEAFDELFGDS